MANALIVVDHGVVMPPIALCDNCLTTSLEISVTYTLFAANGAPAGCSGSFTETLAFNINDSSPNVNFICKWNNTVARNELWNPQPPCFWRGACDVPYLQWVKEFNLNIHSVGISILTGGKRYFMSDSLSGQQLGQNGCPITASGSWQGSLINEGDGQCEHVGFAPASFGTWDLTVN